MENIGDISTIPMTEKQPVILGNQNTGTMTGTTPALYVLVKQTTGKPDQGTLLSNQDNSSLLSNAAKPMKSKAKTYLPADCASGNITVMLDNNNMWNEFYHRSTEMILTKQGRRMFPYCRYWITGLESNHKYILVMDISPVDNFRYKWNGHSWEPSGKAEPHVLGRVFIHPESPSTGHYWMHQPVSFYKLKLTNNTLDQEGHIILHSMHRYLPRLHLVPAEKATEVIQLNGPDVRTFTFPQTEFFAVTAYQNIQITQLKIDYNPFAKGFREDGLSSRLQRDVKQNGSSDRESSSVTSSPTNHGHPLEGSILDPSQRELDPPPSGICDPDLQKGSLSPYHEFLHFEETDANAGDDQGLKEEASESPISNPCQKLSQMTSQLTQEEGINLSIKEEPLDNYEYEPLTCMEGVNVKEEETNNIAEEYSNSDGSMLEEQLEKYSEMDIEFHKEQQINQLGVAKAKMLKLDSGKMPVVYLEPCTIRNTVKVSVLSQALMTTSKNERSPLTHSLDSFPVHFENKGVASPFEIQETEMIRTNKMVSENTAPQIPSEEDVLGRSTETCSSLNITQKVYSCELKTTATSCPSLAKVIFDDQNINTLKTHISGKSIVGNQNDGMSGPRKRGRPRKSKLSEAGRSPKCIAKCGATNNISLGSGSTHLDVNPDLEDVDGMLFVSFVSKEALDVHSFDRAEEKELQNTLNNSLATCNPCTDSDGQRIQQMEKELLEDLKSFKYKQVIHPSLQEVGLKLNFVDPTMSIDLKYLGVQLPLSYSEEYASWKNEGTDSNSADAGLHFISRTGKTNDITKIKGWRGKFHNSSKNEGIILEGLLKNRSAFCSDKLDEYLENEGKLMETSIGFSPSTSSSPIVYQLPTKSTSYVRTLDSVLKKQSTASNLSSYTSKPLGLPSISKKKKEKMKSKKQAVSKSKDKSPPKGTMGFSVAKKDKHKLILEEKVSKSRAIDQTITEKDSSMMSSTEGNLQSKQITVRQVQHQQGSRLSTLSKTQLKLLDLEDCALWDGKPRTYITEERAELSLTILLTAQASLKNKPIHKIIKKKAPACNNDFCRLGCICSSLAVEKRLPTHCRKPDCMFGCTCLKRKVVLVKQKKIQEKPLHGKHKLYRERNQEQQTDVIAKDEQEKMKLKDKKKKKKVEYTICDTEPEKPVKSFPLWVKKDGEVDPEPIYIPTASDVEAAKTAMSPTPDIIPTDDKRTATEVNSMANEVKPLRVYTPRPNPVIREEDKDPVYLYFESMMTCARVRMYERKVKEKGQQEKAPQNCEKHIEKEHDADPQPLKIEEDKDPGEKSWWFSCSAGDPSTSYVHRITPDGKNKLIEIISDCNWEEDRKEILNILSQHIRNKMPKSLKVGHFIIELESESKTWDEKHTPIYSSRVKISMSPCHNENQSPPVVVESPIAGLSPCKRTEKLTTPEKLQEQRKKGLPFYAGLPSAGKLIANTCKYDLNPSGSIQVNGKNSPQAKLLLGQMGALHPASHLAAYLTGRLQSTMFDLSTMILKTAPSNKLAVSESLPTEVSTSETSKTPFSTDTTTVSTARVSAQRQIAPRPLLDGVTNQLTSLNTVGGLQKKASETGSSQSLTGPQKSHTKSISPSAGSTTVDTKTPVTSVASLPVTISSPLQNNNPPDIACTNTVGKQELNISSATDAMEITKPVKSMPFAQSSIPVSTSTAVIPLTVTSPTSSVTSVQPSGLSGIQKSPPSNQKQGATSPPGLPRGAEYRMGTRFILIPVQQCSSTLRPSQNMQLASGKRVVLQPLRHPGAVNLYRHPNGQIIQLVPLQQLQTSGAQSSLQPIMLRNPGSVVGIRLPGPSKLPEIAACQASVVPSVTSTTTTSILSTSPSVLSEFSTAENVSGTSSTTTALLSQTPSPESSLVLSMSSNALSLSPSAETSSLLSMTSSTDIPLLPTTSSTTLVPSTAAISSSLSYSTPVSPTNKSPSIFTVSPNSTNSSLPVPPSTILMSSIIEDTSAASESPVTNWTLQDIRTTAVHCATVTQVTPVNSSGSVSPVGTLTLRISPPGIKSNSDQTGSQSKIKCNASGLPSNINNLISLQSGSFALLQFPGQKNDSSSIAKKAASLEIKISHKKNELSANNLEEDSICSQTAEITDSEISKLKENKLPLHNPDFHSEEITCNRNISEIMEKDAEMLKLPSFSHMLQANIQSDHSYTSEKQKCEENEALIKKKNQDKDDEHLLDKISYPNEKCNEVAVLAHDILLQETSTQNPITESKKAEQKPLDTKTGLITEQSWGKPAQSPKTLNNTEELQTKTKPCLDPWKNEDPELPRQNMKEKCDFVSKEKDKEKVSEKVKINIGKNKNNILRNEYLGSTHKYESSRHFSSYEKSIKDTQEDNQNRKDEHKISKTCGKISRPSLVAQNKINVDADELAEKLRRTSKQNTWKIKSHRKKSSPLIDITRDNTEKDEKTEESANERVDEAFEYQSEGAVNIEVLNGSESSEVEENVDIETVEEFSEKVNLARLKATAAHALLSKQLHLVHNHSNKTTKRHKQSEFLNKKLKNEEQAFANYRQTHTANERRRRKEMRGLFEKLKATLGLQAFPKVSKCFILKQALEEIQGLTDQADKLTGQKNLLLHTQDTLVRKVSALSGKTQEVVLKKLEYIYAKQKAVAAQKGKQKEQTDPTKMIETTQTASPSVEKDPTVLGEVKPMVLSNQRTKPLILSKKGNVTGDLPPSITLANANLLVTTNGQVLAFRSSLVPREVAALPTTLLQGKVKSETEGNDEKEQSENEDSFLMPRIVNVTSLATEEETNLNLDANKGPYTMLNTDSKASELSMKVLSQETSKHKCKENERGSEKERNATGTTQDLLEEKYSFPQILNVSSLKGSPETFGTKLCFEELTGSQTWAKEVDGGGGDCQKSKNPSLQKLQINKAKVSGSEMELQQVASIIHEPTMDTSSSVDIEENDDTDETLTSLLNEIAFLNQQLSDDASDIPELSNPLSSSFSLADTESHQESNSASSSAFQFGTVGGNFKDLSMIQDNGDSITPLLLHLDDDDFPVGNRSAREVSSQSDALKIMLGSEVKDRNSNLLKINRSGKSMESSTKTRSVSPPVLYMKTNLEAGASDMSWRPMPKLAPLGLKTANQSLDSEGQSTKVMPALAPVASKEKKLAQSAINPSQDSKATNTKATAVTKST